MQFHAPQGQGQWWGGVQEATLDPLPREGRAWRLQVTSRMHSAKLMPPSCAWDALRSRETPPAPKCAFFHSYSARFIFTSCFRLQNLADPRPRRALARPAGTPLVGGRPLAVQHQQRDLLQALGPLPSPQVAAAPRRQPLQQPLQPRRPPHAALRGRRAGPRELALPPARPAGPAREQPPPAPEAQARAAVARRPARRRRLRLRVPRAPLQARHLLQQLVLHAPAPRPPAPPPWAGPEPSIREVTGWRSPAVASRTPKDPRPSAAFGGTVCPAARPLRLGCQGNVEGDSTMPA